MSSIPVIKFLFRSDWKVLTDALAHGPAYGSENFENANDLTSYLSNEAVGLVITSLRDKNDLVQLATFIKQSKKVADNTYIKVFVVNFSGDKQFEKAASKLGILDIIDGNVQTKALRFKVDFMMKSVQSHLKKNATSAAGAQSKSIDNGKNHEKKVPYNTPVWSTALECEDDIWLLRNDQDCKRVLGKWLVKFMGPSPFVCQWAETGKAGIWKLQFKAQDNNFIGGQGIWYFHGDQKPEYIWKENRWLLTGSSYELFYKEGSLIHSRVKLREKILTITKNSLYAQTKEQLFIDSFNRELVCSKEQESLDKGETIEAEAEIHKDLEGTVKTELINNTPLISKGKTNTIDQDALVGKGQADSIDYGSLSGKGKTDSIDQGPLTGKNKTDSINQDPLSGKGKTDSIDQGPLAGKNKTDSINANPLGMDLSPGENEFSEDPLSQDVSPSKMSSHWKNKNKYKEEEGRNLEAPAPDDPRQGTLLDLENQAIEQIDNKTRSSAGAKFNADKLGGFLSSPQAEDKKGSSSNELEGPEREKINPKGTSDVSNKDVDYNSSGKVLPFVDKDKKKSPSDELPEELKEAVQTATVICYLVQKTKKLSCDLDDFFEQTIIFKTSESGLEAGEVKLDLNFNYLGKNTKLNFDAKLMSVDQDAEGLNYLTVEISENNIKDFSSFMKLYQDRQKNIHLFIKTAKGY